MLPWDRDDCNLDADAMLLRSGVDYVQSVSTAVHISSNDDVAVKHA